MTASSAADSSSPCKPARGVVQPAELKCSNYSISPYADFEFFVPYLVGKCAMCIACYGFDYVTLFNFTDSLLTFWLFLIQNFRIQFRLRNRQWCAPIDATDVGHQSAVTVAMHRVQVERIIFCIVFSSSFAAVGIDLATDGKLQPVWSDSQHASRRGKRQTWRP